MKKYSEVKKELQFEVDRHTGRALPTYPITFKTTKMAYPSISGRPQEYLSDRYEKLNIVEEPDIQYYIPIKWMYHFRHLQPEV